MKKDTNEIIAIMQTYVPGEKWEYSHDGGRNWSACTKGGEPIQPNWDWGTTEYRKKPEPQLRPWKFHEIPISHFFRIRGPNSTGTQKTIASVTLFSNGDPPMVTFKEYSDARSTSHLFLYWEHRVHECGSSWEPCGVPLETKENQ